MSAPIKNTCPDIDKAIRCLKVAMDEIRDAIEDRRTVRSIEMEIDSAIGYFEDLRSANDALRNWGKEMEDEVENSANYINELENKIESLEKQPV